jgi:hypothetical protein
LKKQADGIPASTLNTAGIIIENSGEAPNLVTKTLYILINTEDLLQKVSKGAQARTQAFSFNAMSTITFLRVQLIFKFSYIWHYESEISGGFTAIFRGESVHAQPPIPVGHFTMNHLWLNIYTQDEIPTHKPLRLVL